MIGRLQPMRPETVAIGGCSPPCSPVWNFGPGLSFNVTPVQLRQEVQVPPVAAELAVGDALQPDRLLVAHRLGDGLVFGPAQLRCIDLATLEAGAQGRRVLQAASKLPTWSARKGMVMARLLAAGAGSAGPRIIRTARVMGCRRRSRGAFSAC